MNNFSNVPPGFRFHPTDEELVDYYLRRKIASRRIDFDVIKEVDLYKIEPWDLQQLCRIGTEEQNDWYFFSHKDKKYPTGTRTNRATSAGFWKATGRDKAIYSKHDLIGMRKTLVFYKGRAPNGQKSDYIMHEYRLETDENGTTGQEEGWVVCRVFKKRIPTTQKFSEHDSPIWYDDQVSFIPDFDSPKHHHHNPYGKINLPHHYPTYNISSCEKEMDLQYGIIRSDHFLQLPFLESPKMIQTHTNSPITSYGSCLNMSPGFNTSNLNSSQEMNLDNKHFSSSMFTNNEQSKDQMTDWRVLDKFVALSQLSQHEISKQNETFPACQDSNMVAGDMNINNDEFAHENATSTSHSVCHIDLWK